MGKTLKKLELEIEKLKTENEIMSKISTSIGFYEYFFKELKNYKTEIECFNEVNKLYFNLFGVYRFENYQTFKSKFSTK